MKINIKNSTRILILASIVGLLIACEKELDVLPSEALTEVDFLSRPENAIQLVTGVYNAQLRWEMYSFAWIGITSITSDDADKGSTPNDTGTDKKKLDELTWDASDISFKDVWNSRYDGIYRANTAFFYLDQTNLDSALKNQLIGEVLFLRSLFYFDLVRCFGGVPIVTSRIDINDTETINEVVFVRRSKEEVYTQIETDLLDAIDRLPVKSQHASASAGKATKGAAQALLAKAYLYQQKWAEAEDMADEVISSGEYSLLSDYADVWKEIGENGSESIYEIQASPNLGVQGYTDVQGPRGTPDLGWGFNTPSLDLLNSYEDGDLRKQATIMIVEPDSLLWDGLIMSGSWNNLRYNYKAYHSSIAESWNGNKSNTAKNLRILKYSDILLIKAESALQQGKEGEALTQVNMLRNRAGLASKGSLSLDELYKERRWEMAMEHDRWFDLVRTGSAQAAMAAQGKNFIVGTHEVFPIPEEQIIASGGLLQQNNY
jgi:starch-binding outer membrane protein, SusD/RagB family